MCWEDFNILRIHGKTGESEKSQVAQGLPCGVCSLGVHQIWFLGLSFGVLIHHFSWVRSETPQDGLGDCTGITDFVLPPLEYWSCQELPFRWHSYLSVVEARELLKCWADVKTALGHAATHLCSQLASNSLMKSWCSGHVFLDYLGTQHDILTSSSFLLLFKCLFYLFGRQSDRGGDRNIFHLVFYSPNVQNVQSMSSPRAELRTPFWSPLWETGALGPGLSSVAFQDPWVWSWIWNKTSRFCSTTRV